MALDSEAAKARAEAKFKKEEARDIAAAEVWAERAKEETARDANMARLKALRLARDAAAPPAAEKVRARRKG